MHHATLHDGRPVAMKIQYPGVAAGIQSDIENLVGVMKVSIYIYFLIFFLKYLSQCDYDAGVEYVS